MKLDQLSRPKKLALGFATIWPFIYMPLFFVFIFSTFLLGPTDSEDFPRYFLYIFPIHFLTIILGFVVLGLFIYDVFKNKRIESDKKALWAVVLFLGNMIATPIYWYLYVWKTPKKSNTRKSLKK